MTRLSYLLFLVMGIVISYGQQNTSQVGKSSLNSALVDLILSAKNEDVANGTSTEAVTIPSAEPEKEAKQAVPSQTDTEQSPCTTWSDAKGVCVPYYTCNFTSPYEEDYGVIDIHGVESECVSYIDVCCALDQIVQVNSTIAPDLTTKQINKSCGHRNSDGVGPNITALGEPSYSKFGEFPWTVAVLKTIVVKEKPEDPKINVYIGGGTLIHPSVVLTAAHLVNKDPEFKIRAGEWDTQTTKEMYPHQDRDVKEVVLHPEFNKKSLHNDIVLLFLSDPVDDSLPHVGMACLPNPGIETTLSKTQCLASGWGKDQFGKEGRYSVVLKKVELPVVDHDDCEKRLRTTRLGARFQLDSSFTCAGGEVGRDTCVGDGGSPLVCPVKDDKDRYVQNGIVAWGIGCGADGIPGVYVDVARFRGWIDENVASHGFDISTYTL